MSGSAELLLPPSASGNDSEMPNVALYGVLGFLVLLLITTILMLVTCHLCKRFGRTCILRLCPAYVIFCCTGAYRRILNWQFRLPGRPTRDAQAPARAPVVPRPQPAPAPARAPVVPRPQPAPAPARAPVVPRPQPAPAPARAPVVPPQPAPVPVPAGRAPQPPAQNIPLVPLQGGDRSSSHQPPPQQVIIAADAHDKPQPPNGDSPHDEHQPHDAAAGDSDHEQKPLLTVRDSQQPPDSPHEQQPLLASRDSHQPLEACEDSDDERMPLLASMVEQQPPTADSSYEQQPLLAAADISDELQAAAGDKQLHQQSDKVKPSSEDERQHKLSLPSLVTQQKPCTTQRAKTSTELDVDEERQILLEDQDCPEEYPVSDQPVLTSDDNGPHMWREYGTSSLHSVHESGPISKFSSIDEDKEEDTAL